VPVTALMLNAYVYPFNYLHLGMQVLTPLELYQLKSVPNNYNHRHSCRCKLALMTDMHIITQKRRCFLFLRYWKSYPPISIEKVYICQIIGQKCPQRHRPAFGIT